MACRRTQAPILTRLSHRIYAGSDFFLVPSAYADLYRRVLRLPPT